jgi:hypothetical protein
MTAPGASFAFSQRPVSRASLPFIGSTLKGSKGSIWGVRTLPANGSYLRKTTIVALARKLLVALWKYVSAGVVIEGAMMRPA